MLSPTAVNHVGQFVAGAIQRLLMVLLGEVEVSRMTMTDRYLAGLPGGQQARLAEVNRSGLTALRHYVDSGRAVAFLGAGTSAPLYPLWHDVIVELIDAARDDLSDQVAGTCQEMAAASPDAVVELVRRHIGQAGFREVLRQVFRARRDPVTGRTWTPVQELIARCSFAGAASMTNKQ